MLILAEYKIYPQLLIDLDIQRMALQYLLIINNIINIINVNLKRALEIMETVCDNSLKYLR